MSMQNSNLINGLFQIPDEGSFLKKLILSHPTTFNPDVPIAFKLLQKHYPEIRLLHKDHYFALMLPCTSEGLELEAMLITTEDTSGEKYFSIYHRLHFDQDLYPDAKIIESDAFLRLSSIVTNVAIDDEFEGLVQLLNHQIKEALNIEITMLTLADGNYEVSENNILPSVMNAVGRSMLAAQLDDVAYKSIENSDALSSLIAQWCDLPLLVSATGVEKLLDWKEDVRKSEEAFMAEYASSTICLMYLYVEHKEYSAIIEKGGFALMKEYLLENGKFFGLKKVVGNAATLGKFKQIKAEDSVLNYVNNA